jgi:hypothetical protein
LIVTLDDYGVRTSAGAHEVENDLSVLLFERKFHILTACSSVVKFHYTMKSKGIHGIISHRPLSQSDKLGGQ